MIDLARHLQEQPVRLLPLGLAKAQHLTHRMRHGMKQPAPILTPPSANVKFAKTERAVYGIALSHAANSGEYNTCRFSTAMCRRDCVSGAGNGRYASTQWARVVKTLFLAEHPSAFVTLVADEIERALRKHDDIAVRLNTFSDLPWEDIAPWLFEDFSTVQFYDYTKWVTRAVPRNYHLTYSASDRTTTPEIQHRVRLGENVAVVFESDWFTHLENPTWAGLPVHNGDDSDDRSLDPRGVVVGLKAKGRMRTSSNPMARSAA